ncbi:hypothetical protein FGADI_10234 [Fusarium gaditjirri]|uniref:DUF7872 domain-containing protein n=1 Tax=Fusarium gaditjirri TaxID=282569 RepID=A0A8H4SY09_9HYPO|nr:hypothetical protein FGADI_10234 [Fusarium gaditjirri]
MRSISILYAILAASSVFGLAIRQSGTGAKSCDTEPLAQITWINLGIDKFLKDWTPNVTATPTNNVQALADSFGAPNFFCGLDQFCNAGQPCVPVEPPAWYALLAIQNWNNYMNSLNTAISFSSSIIGLKLPEIVSDLYPDPKDNVTPLQLIARAITSTMGVIPLSGGINVAKDAFTASVNYVLTVAKPPTTDKFMQWSNVASSLSGVIQDYQAALSDSFKKVIDTPVGDAGGIYDQLHGGSFLGISQNFTQSAVQKQMIDSFTLYSIGLALQAQKIFVLRMSNIQRKHDDSSASFAVDAGDGTFTEYSLMQAGGNDNAIVMLDIGDKLSNKYSLPKDRWLTDVVKCWEGNGKKQLADGFGDFLPVDPTTPCLLNMNVCDLRAAEWGSKGIIERCRDAGIDI